MVTAEPNEETVLLRFKGRHGPVSNTLTIEEAIDLETELEEAIATARSDQT